MASMKSQTSRHVYIPEQEGELVLGSSRTRAGLNHAVTDFVRGEMGRPTARAVAESPRSRSVTTAVSQSPSRVAHGLPYGL
jgi:hypothetical protein